MLQLPEHRRGDPYWEKRRAEYLAERKAGHKPLIQFATASEATAMLRLLMEEEKATGVPTLFLFDDGLGDDDAGGWKHNRIKHQHGETLMADDPPKHAREMTRPEYRASKKLAIENAERTARRQSTASTVAAVIRKLKGKTKNA